MRIAQIVASLEARHGGPSVSVPRLADAQAADQEVTVFTTGNVPTSLRESMHCSVHTGPRGWPESFCLAPGLRQALATFSPDVLHSHGLWLRALHHADMVAARLRRPHVISPRGMMSRWAWRHRRIQKVIAERLLHPHALKRVSGWHATSPEERDEIRSLGFPQPICVAPNGVTLPSAREIAANRAYWHQLCPATRTHRTALFYSRFHRKKRVVELIDVWLATAPADWTLLLVGVPQDYRVEQLESYVHRCSGSGRVHVFSGENRPSPYAVASLFLLPSHNENFGLVVAEAMAHGVAPLVTDSTPWRFLEREAEGWCVPWDNYGEAIRGATAQAPHQLSEYGANAARLVARDFSWDVTARTLNAFYAELSSSPATSP